MVGQGPSASVAAVAAAAPAEAVRRGRAGASRRGRRSCPADRRRGNGVHRCRRLGGRGRRHDGLATCGCRHRAHMRVRRALRSLHLRRCCHGALPCGHGQRADAAVVVLCAGRRSGLAAAHVRALGLVLRRRGRMARSRSGCGVPRCRSRRCLARGRGGRRMARGRRRGVAGGRAHPGAVPGGEAGRCRYAVAAGGVVVVPVVPAGRPPVRHEAQRRERGNREYGGSGCRVPVHRPPVGVAEDGEAVSIVAGRGPRHSGADTAVRVKGRIPGGRRHTGAADDRYSG